MSATALPSSITQIQSTQLSGEALEEVCQLIRQKGAEILATDNPKTTLEDLFLAIVEESQARPGKRVYADKDER